MAAKHQTTTVKFLGGQYRKDLDQDWNSIAPLTKIYQIDFVFDPPPKTIEANEALEAAVDAEHREQHEKLKKLVDFTDEDKNILETIRAHLKTVGNIVRSDVPVTKFQGKTIAAVLRGIAAYQRAVVASMQDMEEFVPLSTEALLNKADTYEKWAEFAEKRWGEFVQEVLKTKVTAPL